MDSILTSIKRLLGITDECKDFDDELVMHINSALAILSQFGVGPEKGFSITGDAETWNDFMENDARLGFVKSYIHLKVRLLFDPPASSSHVEAIHRTLGELEFRITTQVDYNKSEKEDDANG